MGFAIEIPTGYYAHIYDRSGNASKRGIHIMAGVIDSGYRGEVIVKFDKQGNNCYEPGDRVAQLLLVPIPSINFVEVINLPNSDRGTGGFGSSGR